MKKVIQNYQKIKEGKNYTKKRKDIKKFWTIHFLTKTTQKCENFEHILLIIRFLVFITHISERNSLMTGLYQYKI